MASLLWGFDLSASIRNCTAAYASSAFLVLFTGAQTFLKVMPSFSKKCQTAK